MEKYLQQLLASSSSGQSAPQLNLDMKRMGSHGHSTKEFQLLAQFQQLKNLSMIDCQLSSLQGFPHLAQLQKLNLSDNKISLVDPLVSAQLQQLKHLDLSNNRIRDFKTIQILQLLPSLQHLILLECPITQMEGYREMVFDLVPNLQTLDGEDADGIELDTELETDGAMEDDSEDEGSEEEEDSEEDSESEKRSAIKTVGGKTGGKSRSGKQGAGKFPTVRSPGKTPSAKTYSGKAPGKSPHIRNDDEEEEEEEDQEPEDGEEDIEEDIEEEEEFERSEEEESEEEEDDYAEEYEHSEEEEEEEEDDPEEFEDEPEDEGSAQGEGLDYVYQDFDNPYSQQQQHSPRQTSINHSLDDDFASDSKSPPAGIFFQPPASNARSRQPQHPGLTADSLKRKQQDVDEEDVEEDDEDEHEGEGDGDDEVVEPEGMDFLEMDHDGSEDDDQLRTTMPSQKKRRT